MDPPFTLELIREHPDTSPDAGVRGGHYLICGPSAFSSNAEWIDFRDRSLLPMVACYPEDAFLADFVRQVENILRWRATIPAGRRFWKTDPKIVDAAS